MMITHDALEAVLLADRIAVLRAGAVEQVGSPRELYERPATLFVARFLGMPEMNTLAGRVAAGVLTVEAGGTMAMPGRADGAITVGVRAEDLSICESGVAADLTFPATVDVVENLGWDSLVHLRVGGSSVVARAESSKAPVAGAQVRLGCAAARMHLFDEAGARMPALAATAVAVATERSP